MTIVTITVATTHIVGRSSGSDSCIVGLLDITLPIFFKNCNFGFKFALGASLIQLKLSHSYQKHYLFFNFQ